MSDLQKEYSKYILSIGEASKIMKVHRDTLMRWEKKGILVPIRVGEKQERRYSNEQLDALIIEFMSHNNLSTKYNKYAQSCPQTIGETLKKH